MEATLVTSKVPVTMPKALRQWLGIRQGTRIEFLVVGDHAEFLVKSPSVDVPESGFCMVRSKRRAVPADFDPASLLKP